MWVEPLVTFSDPHNSSGVSQTEGIPPSADAAGADGGQMFKKKKNIICSFGVISRVSSDE